MPDIEVALFKGDADKMLNKLQQRFDLIKNKNDQIYGLFDSVVYGDIIEHFEGEQGPEGKWKKWSDLYTEHMRKIGKGGNKILQDSGRLRQNFKATNRRKTNDGIVWYNNAKTKKGFPYAFAHNEGGGQLPQRRFMWLSKKALDRLEQNLLKYFMVG
jgi:phage gpG-like protein